MCEPVHSPPVLALLLGDLGVRCPLRVPQSHGRLLLLFYLLPPPPLPLSSVFLFLLSPHQLLPPHNPSPQKDFICKYKVRSKYKRCEIIYKAPQLPYAASSNPPWTFISSSPVTSISPPLASSGPAASSLHFQVICITDSPMLALQRCQGSSSVSVRVTKSQGHHQFICSLDLFPVSPFYWLILHSLMFKTKVLSLLLFALYIQNLLYYPEQFFQISVIFSRVKINFNLLIGQTA